MSLLAIPHLASLMRAAAAGRAPRPIIRLAAVRTVQAELAFEFGDPRFQGRIVSPQRRNQRIQSFPGGLVRRFATHPILESETESAVQRNLVPGQNCCR